jgi:hypothetical protein
MRGNSVVAVVEPMMYEMNKPQGKELSYLQEEIEEEK